MNRPKILIVEDEFLVREMLKWSLEEIGCQVIGEAADGFEAVELAHRLRPDLILMDLDMPRLNGLEATRRILESFKIPVVLVTGSNSNEVSEQASAAGVVACLDKPVMPYELVQVITLAVAR